MVIPVYIDLNVGIGRTGIAPDRRALDLFDLCYLLYGIVPMGFIFMMGT